jgi:hypothetical protein
MKKAERKPLPQYAAVEQPLGCDPPIVHCPICGEAMFTEGECSPCAHLAFVYIGELGEFEYQSKDFGKRVQKVALDEVSLKDVSTILKKAGYDNKLLALEVTYGGMMCGPAWFTDVFGFDYGTLVGSQ